MMSPEHFPSSSPSHPFANTTKTLEILPNRIDIEQESRLYEELAYNEEYDVYQFNSPHLPPMDAQSSYSDDIWIGDNSGESSTFAREVMITGWTNVGDRPRGGYIVYDCAVRTDEGTTIHTHKRYSDFVELEAALRHALPRQHRHIIPELPPKTALARYRPAFLDRRRRLLQSWLTAILLHPDMGGLQPAKKWIVS